MEGGGKVKYCRVFTKDAERGHMACFEFPRHPILSAGANTRQRTRSQINSRTRARHDELATTRLWSEAD